MPLVSAERLHRWPCDFCGSKDKNIASYETAADGKDMKKGTFEAVKIVTCNQCGRTSIYAHSSLALARLLTGKAISLKESEEYVTNFHEMNHSDPMANPHSYHDSTKKHNPGTDTNPDADWYG